MRIEIDANRCTGHGRCYSVAPDLLSDDPEGFVAERGKRWEIPAGLVAQAEQAADACPESSIRIVAGA